MSASSTQNYAGNGGNTWTVTGLLDVSNGTINLPPGAVSANKLNLSGVKTLSAAGHNGNGSITLTGTAVGDRLVSAVGFSQVGGTGNVTGVTLGVPGTTFESTISVANQIQQINGAGNLANNTYVFTLIPVAS